MGEGEIGAFVGGKEPGSISIRSKEEGRGSGVGEVERGDRCGSSQVVGEESGEIG